MDLHSRYCKQQNTVPLENDKVTLRRWMGDEFVFITITELS